MAGVSLRAVLMMPFWGGLPDRLCWQRVPTLGLTAHMVLVTMLPMPIMQSERYPSYAEQVPNRV